MPKKDKKASKKDKSRDPADVVDAVRGAVERTFQATAGGTEGARDRGRSLLDEVGSVAQRLRESFDDLRVLEDVRGLRAEIEALSRRVGELEKQAAAAPPAAPAGRAAGSGRTTGTAARASAARTTASNRRTSAARTTARKPPAKPSAAGTAAKTTGPKAKPKPAAARRKPASGGTG